MVQIHRISSIDTRAAIADLIFVHGLDGHPFDTWQADAKADNFWPRWISEDLPAIAVHSLGYAADSTAWKGHGLGLYDRATSILALLEAQGIGERPLLFVAHSLGGLIVKQLLRNAESDGTSASANLLANVRGAAFLATPHNGSRIADTASFLRLAVRPTPATDNLTPNNETLRELNIWFRNNVGRLGISIKTFFETRNLKGVRIVDEASSDPGLLGVVPIPVDADHIQIAKPSTRDELVYVAVRKFMADCVDPRAEAAEPAPTPEQVAPPPNGGATSTLQPPVATAHRRQFADEAITIDDAALIAHAANPSLNESIEFQAKFARELAAYLRSRGMRLGTACAAWVERDTLLLSCLPDFVNGQRTYAFKPQGKRFALSYYWEPRDSALGPLDTSEWQPVFAHLTADRIPIDLDRDATLYLLEQKGASLGYPLSPDPVRPPALCQWISGEDRPDDYFEWAKDPRLIAGNIVCTTSAFHRPTRVALYSFCLQGRWSPAAFVALHDALLFYLPTRFTMSVQNYGSILVTIYLGNPNTYSPALARATMARCNAALVRTMAAYWDLPIAPLKPSFAAFALDPADAADYRDAVKALGDRTHPPVVDQSAPQFARAKWIKLRHAFLVRDLGRVDVEDITPIDIGEHVTASAVQDALAELEGPTER